ncbi:MULTISPECIES: hypothetical protein [Oerskovia]|uniref:Uncharacterized protein n=1 Tax=Oerskovia rustica TaxID=2762237 RepID=A0ABR8RNF0_9CELL|nr:hypothetical protein [Oerskovia rustica]MBD7949320.1 hypothetical protein [Oerskovia rustica]
MASLLLVVASGCVSGGTESDSTLVTSPQVEMSAEQASALEDDEVDREEYEAGFRRYVACMNGAGFEVLGGDVSSAVISYSIAQAAIDEGVEAECYGSEFEHLDRKWQVANEDTSDTAMFFRDCLERNGIEPPDTLEEILVALEEAGIERPSCATGG